MNNAGVKSNGQVERYFSFIPKIGCLELKWRRSKDKFRKMAGKKIDKMNETIYCLFISAIFLSPSPVIERF